MDPYRARRKSKKRKSNWGELWKQLRFTYQEAGMDRQVAVLDNYAKNKESICRKLGVICSSDISRIHAKIKSTS